MLTPRQRQIAELVAADLSSKAIARELRLSVETVEAHIRDAARRLPGEGRQRFRLMLWYLSLEDS